MNTILSYDKDGRIIQLLNKGKGFFIKDNQSDEFDNIVYTNMIIAKNKYEEHIEKTEVNNVVKVQASN